MHNGRGRFATVAAVLLLLLLMVVMMMVVLVMVMVVMLRHDQRLRRNGGRRRSGSSSGRSGRCHCRGAAAGRQKVVQRERMVAKVRWRFGEELRPLEEVVLLFEEQHLGEMMLLRLRGRGDRRGGSGGRMSGRSR